MAGVPSHLSGSSPSVIKSTAPVIGPLPAPKTITITFVPDWNQVELRSPMRPVILRVILGAAGTPPEKALWAFEFRIYAMKFTTGPDKYDDDEAIPRGSRALLWFSNKAHPKYEHAVVAERCKMSTTDELKTISVAMRPFSEEKHPHALLYARRNKGSDYGGYIKVVQGHHYYLNITFAAGSAIAQLVGLHGWRPIIYLTSQRLCLESAAYETIQQQFTNFVTNWAQGVEVNPNECERGVSLDKGDARKTVVTASTPRFSPVAKPTTYPSLIEALRTQPLQSILLPRLDESKYTPVFPLHPSVDRFYRSEDAPIAPAMLALESVARTASLDPNNPANERAKDLLSCLSAVSQLSGWQHVSNYISNPRLYLERTKSAQRGEENIPMSMPAPIIKDSMDDFQSRGQKLVKRLCQRLDWMLDMQHKAGGKFDAELNLRLIAADHEWRDDVKTFIKEAEVKVSEMLTRNQLQFQAFRELQRRGVSWPHSLGLRKEIERAGFVFRPMMIKRDRCVCEICNVQVSGWRPWHNPWSFHNYARHPPSFQAQMRPLVHAPGSQAVAEMITGALIRKAQDAVAGSSAIEMDAKDAKTQNSNPFSANTYSGGTGARAVNSLPNDANMGGKDWKSEQISSPNNCATNILTMSNLDTTVANKTSSASASDTSMTSKK